MGTKKFVFNQASKNPQMKDQVTTNQKVSTNDKTIFSGPFICPWSKIGGQDQHQISAFMAFALKTNTNANEENLKTIDPVLLDCPTCTNKILINGAIFGLKNY